MRRRHFIATAALAPLAQHVTRVITHPPKPKRHRPRRQFAILILVVPPADWQPSSWRDVPPVAPGSPISIVDSYKPVAIGVCRSVAKLHNQRQAENGTICTWAIVACNDGRYQPRKGGAL